MTVYAMLFMIFICVFLASVCLAAVPVKWDYMGSPVQVEENRKGAAPVMGLAAKCAFDGYGAQGARPALTRAWHQKQPPTEESPCTVDIDYGKPVDVTAFVNYFYVPMNLDLRMTSPGPSAFEHVRIYCKDDGGEWQQVCELKDMPFDCPQVLPVTGGRGARFWRIEVLGLALGAEALMSYEIETYTGGVPTITLEKQIEPDMPAVFATRVKKHKPEIGVLKPTIWTRGDTGIPVTFDTAGGRVEALLDVVDGDGVEIKATPCPMGILAELTYNAKPDDPIKYRRVDMQLSVPGGELFYIPAYAWSRTPVDAMPNSFHLQTRMAAIGAKGATVCVMPGTDRGWLGFVGGTMRSRLLVGPSPMPVLISAVPGDWWQAYKFAIGDAYGFREQKQTVPVSEMQYGVSRYMMCDELWDATLGTVRSWPNRDPHYALSGNGFDAFQFYGSTYSIPTYWARYVMNGDPRALERCRSIAYWMCRSGVRQQDGPAKGAFYNLQRFTKNTAPTMDKPGCTQASTRILTSQSTGSALWTLLFYRRMTGEQDPEINAAITDATEWLLKTQTADGGWPYGHDPEGKPVDGAPSSGAIWNIWALWRLGQETGDSRCIGAAARGVKWFDEAFVHEHHYHGYWEDVGPGSREGYDAGIAAVAFMDMGEKGLVVETARDAMQWVFTRQLEFREPTNSAGLVAEQTGWPPAAYCNPMMALAAHSAWLVTKDDEWRRFAMIPKAIGWWYEPESGAMTWIVDSTQAAPMAGQLFESWWGDWCIAQTGTLTLRWLIREIERLSGGLAEFDEETLKGKLLSKQVTAWAPPGGLKPTLPTHGQVNWLGFRGEDSIFVALMNDGAGGDVSCKLDSRDVNATILRPERVHRIVGGKATSAKWSGGNVIVTPNVLTVLEWHYKR